MNYCDQIFSFEKTIKDLSPGQRQKQRQLLIKPVIEEFFEWLESFYVMKGKLQTAVYVCLKSKDRAFAFSRRWKP